MGFPPLPYKTQIRSYIEPLKLSNPHNMLKQLAVRKAKILLTLILVFTTSSVFSQHVELTAFGGGTFAAGINSYSTNYYKAQIGGSWHFGGALDYFFRAHSSIGVTVFDQPTTGYLFGSGNTKTVSAPMSMTYILLAFNQYVGHEKIRGYGGIGMGAVVISPSGYGSATKFAIDIHAGVKFDVSDHIGLRLQVQLDQPVDGGGFGIGVGTGGAAVGVSTYSTILQLGGNLGIVHRFGNH